MSQNWDNTRLVGKPECDLYAYPPNEPGHPDLAGFPELSLALKTEEGVVLITGCSHSKVEEIIRATKQYLGSNIELVEGGFHLFPYDAAYISNIAHLMKDDLGVRRVAPAHCTGNLAFKIFRDVYGENYNYAGVESEVMFLTDVASFYAAAAVEAARNPWQAPMRQCSSQTL
jgi:metal-dependent hydrolase (beta-lactamase superfamily II)